MKLPYLPGANPSSLNVFLDKFWFKFPVDLYLFNDLGLKV